MASPLEIAFADLCAAAAQCAESATRSTTRPTLEKMAQYIAEASAHVLDVIGDTGRSDRVPYDLHAKDRMAEAMLEAFDVEYSSYWHAEADAAKWADPRADEADNAADRAHEALVERRLEAAE